MAPEIQDTIPSEGETKFRKQQYLLRRKSYLSKKRDVDIPSMVKPFKSGTSSGALQQRIGPSGHWSPENPVPSVRNLFEILREHERERMQGTREGLGGYEARQSEEAQRAQKKGKGSADSGPSETGIGEARSSYDRNAPNGAQSGKGSEDTATSSKVNLLLLVSPLQSFLRLVLTLGIGDR